MDPDANLAERRRLSADIAAAIKRRDELPATDDVLRLLELVMAMDVWLSTGGALPRAWGRGR